MKTIQLLLCLVMIGLGSWASAQSKGEMPFTSSSPNANKLIRNAWIALSESRRKEAADLLVQVLSEDSNCGMAYASLGVGHPDEHTANVRKAAGLKLSADERMLIDGFLAGWNRKSNAEFFEPLVNKYPKDYYLHLWIMYMHSDKARAIAIGENIAKRNPKFSPVYNLLGYLYMDINDLAKAQGSFDKYILLRPELANAYDSKGDYMMHTGKTDQAIQLYEKAFSLGMASSEEKAEAARTQLKFPKPSESDASKIKDIILASFEATKESNTDKLLKDYSEHAVEIFGNQAVNVGLPNLHKRVSRMFKNGTFTRQDFTLQAINGTGPIAVAYGKNHYTWKESASGDENQEQGNAIFLMRKQNDGTWKVLADHFYSSDQDSQKLSFEDIESVNDILDKWVSVSTEDETLSEKNLEALSSLYSEQAIEILPSQISNIGIANLRSRWEGLIGSRFEKNSLGPLGVEGIGRRAVAWGIGNQRFYRKDSMELQQSQFPWAMILTKEKDNVWRILAIHWGAD